MKPIRVCLLLFLLVSCTAGDGDGDGNSVPPGDQVFTPDPSDTGSGKPAGATDFTCDAVAECDYWYCRCEDGFVVNAANCKNGYCMDAASSCPSACEYFEHGSWTGEAGGGPKEPTPTPTPSECGEQGSTNDTCWSCVEDECCGDSAACYDNPDCLDYWDCLYGCGFGFACEDSCRSLYPDGVYDYENLSQCVDFQCSQDCG